MSSFNSIINKINNNYNKRNKTLPLKRDIRKSAIYSTEFARDIVKIAQCKTIQQYNNMALESFENVRAYEWLIRDTNKDFQERRIRINKMKRYSIEAANYLYSLEEENKIFQWFKKIIDFFKKLFEKLWTFITSKYKAMVNYIKKLTEKSAKDVYSKFKIEKFKNMDAKIVVHPLHEDLAKSSDVINGYMNIVNTMESNLKQKINEHEEKSKPLLDKIKNKDWDSLLYKDDEFSKFFDALDAHEQYDRRQIFQSDSYVSFYVAVFEDVDEKKNEPRTRQMTVGEYLHCEANTKPPLLEILSPSLSMKMQSFEENMKKINMLNSDTVKACEVLLKEIDAAEKEPEPELEQEETPIKLTPLQKFKAFFFGSKKYKNASEIKIPEEKKNGAQDMIKALNYIKLKINEDFSEMQTICSIYTILVQDISRAINLGMS